MLHRILRRSSLRPTAHSARIRSRSRFPILHRGDRGTLIELRERYESEERGWRLDSSRADGNSVPIPISSLHREVSRRQAPRPAFREPRWRPSR